MTNSSETDPPVWAKQAAERHKPLLVLYPEISSERRAIRPDWREEHKAPLSEDYHPYEVKMVLDHSLLPRQAFVHDAEGLLDGLAQHPDAQRIDIFKGPGHGDRDAFWAEYHRIVQNIGHNHSYKKAAYANVVEGRDLGGDDSVRYAGLLAIQYWFLFPYNDWKATHEGDWEMVVVFLQANPTGKPAPVACAYSAHHGGYRSTWSLVEKANDAGELDQAGSHPVVYVANGSHANYFYGPATYSTSSERFGVRIETGEFPFTGEFMDFTTSFQDGVKVFPEVRVVPKPATSGWSGEWRWLNFGGEWGSWSAPQILRRLHFTRSIKFFQKVWAAPGALPPRRNWANPFSWADTECEELQPPDSWLQKVHEARSPTVTDGEALQ